jgi:hypothetical protein
MGSALAAITRTAGALGLDRSHPLIEALMRLDDSGGGSSMISGGSEIVWRPGGPAVDNAYPTFPAAHAAATLLLGRVEIVLDSSFSALFPIPAGLYDMQRRIGLTGIQTNPNTPQFPQLQAGATLKDLVDVKLCVLQSVSGTPSLTFSGPSVMVVEGGGIQNAGAGPMIDLSDMLVLAMRSSVLLPGAPIINASVPNIQVILSAEECIILGAVFPGWLTGANATVALVEVVDSSFRHCRNAAFAGATQVYFLDAGPPEFIFAPGYTEPSPANVYADIAALSEATDNYGRKPTGTQATCPIRVTDAYGPVSIPTGTWLNPDPTQTSVRFHLYGDEALPGGRYTDMSFAAGAKLGPMCTDFENLTFDFVTSVITPDTNRFTRYQFKSCVVNPSSALPMPDYFFDWDGTNILEVWLLGPPAVMTTASTLVKATAAGAGALVLRLQGAQLDTDAITGPAGNTYGAFIDASSLVLAQTLVPVFTVTLTDIAGTSVVGASGGVAYVAVAANWVVPPPVTVKEALDRIAAALGPI